MANNTNLSFPSAFYQQFFDKNGKPLVGGKLYTYIAGSSTSVVTYKTIGGGTEYANMNTNPIILDMSGMADLVISNDTAYKFILFDKNNVKIDEWDNVTAGGSGSSGSNVYVEGTNGEIDVQEESEGLIRRFIISLSVSVKNALSNLSSRVDDIINTLYNKKDKQQPVTKLGSTTKVPVSFQQDANGELDVEFDDITFPDWTTAINNAVADCENTNNKKNSVTGYESSTSAYPSIKAVVDFVNRIMQNLGGKPITDNGNPFSDSDDLPSTTPYQGVNISDKDYAYVQGTGFAERWSASVSGSDVTWVQEYSINIPVFTPAQQAAIDSTATATKINNYDLHIANTSIHVTSTEKNTWNAKQNAISDLAEIRSGAAAGATALQPSGNGSNVTSTFTAASSRTNISSGEKLSTIFGKIAKWFADLKSVAFSGSYNDLTDKPTIPIVNNGKLTIYRNGTALGSFAANQSSLLGIDIIVPTKTSDLNNDSSFLTESGNGSNVTSTFSEASSRSNISSGENLSTIFGKIKKFFSDLKSVAFTGNYSDLNGTPTIPEAATSTPQPVSSSAGSTGSSDYFAKGDHVHKIVVGEGVNNGQVSIAGTSVSVKGWATKQDALPVGATPIDTYSINISGTAGRANNATNDSRGYNIYQNYMRTSAGTNSLSFGSTTTIGSVNGSNVVLSMPQANFISKDLDLATGFSLSVCQFVCHESVPPDGTWNRYDGTDVCNAFKTKIGFDWGISATDYDGKANKATHDALGNVIATTYATKQELSDTATGLGSSIANAVNGIYDSMNRGCVRSAFDYESIAGKFTDVFSVKRESTSIVEAVVRLKVWGKYSYISATNDHTFCADITVQIRGESGNSNWTGAIADGCILYKGTTSSVSDLRVKMTTDSDNRLYISILAANASVSYTRMIVESAFMTTNQERATFSNLVSIYGSVPAGRSAIGDEFSLT